MFCCSACLPCFRMIDRQSVIRSKQQKFLSSCLESNDESSTRHEKTTTTWCLLVCSRMIKMLWILVSFNLIFLSGLAFVPQIDARISPPVSNTNLSRPNPSDAIVSCYYSYKDLLDPNLCTHLMVAGAAIFPNGDITFTLNSTVIKEILTLKEKNPNLVISVSAFGNLGVALTEPKRVDRLANEILNFLQESKFDGFDLDWEINTLFPVKPPYVGMAELFRVLRQKFQSEPRRLYLTAAVFAVPLDIVFKSYDVPALNRYLDFINLMTYDFYQYLPTQPYTGHNAPLFKRPEEFWIFGQLNTVRLFMAWAAENWNKEGMDRNKIAVGIPTYGHTYTLLFSFWHTLRAPATGFGSLGRFVTYAQVCNLLKNDSYTRVWDVYAQVPYCYKFKQWISYDDLESVTGKAEWIKKEGFGGAMIYDFYHDDPYAECDGKTKFPLHDKVWSILKR